jgi:hypothetical protein
LVFVAELSLRPMAESDLFFRIRVGQEIVARHGLLGRNLFSFTYPNHPDLDAAWLFEVMAAALYAVGGFGAIVIAKTAVLLVAFGGLYVVARRAGAGRAASALVLAMAALVARDRLVERPHVFSFVGEAGILLAVHALGTRPFARSPREVVAAIWIGVALWANLHAGVFVAPLMLAAAALGSLADRSAGRARTLGVAAAGAVVATLVTPLGTGLYRYLALHPAITAVHPIDEFRRPTWSSDAPLLLYVAAVALAVAASLAPKPLRRDRGRWAQAAVVVPLLVLAARSVRFGADLALVVAPLGAVALSRTVGWVLHGQVRRALFTPARSQLTAQGPAIGVAALLLGMAVLPRLRAREPLRIGLDARELPLAAIAFVDRNGLRDRMYNDFEIGSYLLFEPEGGYPRHRVFVDPRLPAYPLEMHRLLGRGDLSRDEWNAAMERYGVESALLAYADVNRRVAWWDPERWALVFRAQDARVFVRRLPRYRALIADHEIPATFEFSEETGNSIVALDAPPTGSPVLACEWQRRVGDLLLDLDQALSARVKRAYGRALEQPGCLAPADAAALCAWLDKLADPELAAACARTASP